MNKLLMCAFALALYGCGDEPKNLKYLKITINLNKPIKWLVKSKK